MFEVEIARGMSLLTDSQIAEIDVDRLRMSSCSRCVLGQLYGDFDTSTSRVLLDTPEVYYIVGGHWARGRYFGFVLSYDDDRSPEETEKLYDILGKEWRAAITARREGKRI